MRERERERERKRERERESINNQNMIFKFRKIYKIIINKCPNSWPKGLFF